MARKAGITLLIGIALGFVWVSPGNSASNAEMETLKKEVEALRSEQAAIRKDLDELKALIKGQAAAAPQRIETADSLLSIDGSPYLGRKDAPVTLIEFFDYECPFCMRHVQQTLPQIERDYIQSGKVKYVVRDFPIDSLHPNSFRKHEAAHCAGDQGKYWEMRARLLGTEKFERSDDFSEDASALGLNSSVFGGCLKAQAHAPAVRTDIEAGNKAGVFGSPTFFLGVTDPAKPSIQVVRVIRGAQSYQIFKDAIEGLLQSPVSKN